MIAGLIDLYEASGETRWLTEALALDATLQRLYEDEQHGGCFMTSAEDERPRAGKARLRWGGAVGQLGAGAQPPAAP